MIVSVNGERRELPQGATVAGLIDHLSTATRGVAVAIDGQVVPRGEWELTALSDGARVEVVAAIQGG